MTLTEQTFAQAVLLSGIVEGTQEQMLKVLCQSAVSSLSSRLRPGLSPEDCKADFIAAASLFALAALSEPDEVSQLQKMQIGDVTMQRGNGNAAAKCLRSQANLMISPYLCDKFTFRGV